MMPTRAQRIEGGLWGLLVGDAVGVPYEFKKPEQIPPRHMIDMIPPPDFPRAHQSIPIGSWSDDGAQALALLDSLLDRGQLDPDDLGRRLIDWFNEGRYAVGGVVFDLGLQTSHAIRNLMSGVPADRSGPSEESANGNGSLMRVLPLALWHNGDDAELVCDAFAQSAVTHGHLRSKLCCALNCLWARRLLDEAADPWAEAVLALRTILAGDQTALEELETVIRPDDPPHGQGTGYVLDCLHSARLCLEAGTYPEVIRAAIALGNDTDTTACVAGGLAGIRDGVAAIPKTWLDQLHDKHQVQPLLNRLLALRA